MNGIKSTGLFLFVSGFLIFLSCFFITGFELRDHTLKKELTSSQFTAITPFKGQIVDQNYKNSFTFVANLNEVFQKANNALLTQYGNSEKEIEALVASQTDNQFSLKTLSLVFNSGSKYDSFKIKAFTDYGNWLEGRSFETKTSLKEQINSVSDNIKTYGIINQFGFDRYQSKYLSYSIAKSAYSGPVRQQGALLLWLTYGLCLLGAALYILPKAKEGPAGIKNNGIYHSAMSNTGWLGIVTGAFLIGFYIVLYFYKEHMTPWIIMVDPVSMAIKKQPASEFFLYGFLYTLCILVMGVRMILKYRHSKYQIFRTISVMFFQTAFAFLIPEILIRLNKPYFDFKNIWPLDYDFFFDNELNTLVAEGSLGLFMLGWGTMLIVLGVPIMVYFFGKRWYCSWVCGCGGLAETLGDPYRQLSDKSVKAWKFERWSIHLILVFAVIMTAGVLYTYWTGEGTILGINTYKVREIYGAAIGAAFAGVIGTGFYPLMGNRVWCRFGCPLAAYLGLIQRFKSRFRITTNGGQCISCGNCSTYCEMGIDVRWYAQRGQNIIRSSCVGCGVCSSVCPRGVLNLETKDEEGRFNQQVLLGNDSFDAPSPLPEIK